MKYELFGFIFKKEMNRYTEMMIEKNRKLHDEKKKNIVLKEKLDRYETVFNHVFNKNSYFMLGREVNRENAELYVLEDISRKEIDLYLYSVKYGRNVAYINLEIKKDTSEYELLYLNIIDIISPFENRGNGTILLCYAKMIAEKIGAAYISGSLSGADKDHFEKLKHFYTKAGFQITFNSNRTSGEIKFELD